MGILDLRGTLVINTKERKMGKIAKDEFVVLCDDIREETGNKRSLMGVYSDNLILKNVPATLPKICLYIMLGGIKRQFENIHVTTKLPKLEPHSFELKALPLINVGQNMSMGIVISPFKVQSQGNARFEIRLDNDEKSSLIYKFKILVEE